MARKNSFYTEIRQTDYRVLLVIVAVIGYVLYKIMKTPTMLGDFLTKIFNPDTAMITEHKESTFDAAPTGSTTWTNERIRSDAREVAYCLGTGLNDNWFDHWALPGTKEKAYKILCNYTNKAIRDKFKQAYRTIYTKQDDLTRSCQSYLSSEFVHDLTRKGII